jgi:hypothetical protein
MQALDTLLLQVYVLLRWHVRVQCAKHAAVHVHVQSE